MADIIKRHDDDVIFSYESLQEFIRLIQRQGINNLTIYSVNELLANDKYKTITTRMPPPTFPSPPQEFSEDELKGRRNYFVFVRYSFPWEQGGDEIDGVYISNNEKNGRHVFIQTVNDIKFYKKLNSDNKTINTNDSSVFSQDVSNGATIIKEDDILNGNTNYYNRNGTFTVTIDNTQYVIKIRGFNDDGKYTGEFLPGQGTEKFLRGDGSWTNTLEGTFTAHHLYPVTTGTYDLGSTTKYWKNLYLTGNILPETNNSNNNQISDSNLGASNQRWNKLWAKDGDFSGSVNIGGNLTIGGADSVVTINGRKLEISRIPSTISTTAYFWRGDGQWSNILSGSLTINSSNTTGVGLILSDDGDIVDNNDGYCTMRFSNGVCITAGKGNNTSQISLGSNGYVSAVRVYNAVFNDYAECRKTIDLEAGRVVQDNDDGSLSCTSQRLIPGCHIISDTYGNLMGETEDCKTPIAVAGRVLVYPYQNHENYHAGMSVCAAPNGTVDIMTREEIINYPDCIIGTVSEIPNYETWGTDNVKVNGRIWIYVK